MKTVVIKSLYSVLSIFLNSFSYLFYSKLSKGYRNIFFKRKIIPSVTKRGGYFKCTNQSFQYFNIHKNIILIYDFLVSTKILYGKYSRCTNINSHQGFYLKAHVKNNACNSFSTFLSPQCFPPKGRKDPVGPIICCHVKPTEHLRGCNRLRIHPHFPVWSSTVYSK